MARPDSFLDGKTRSNLTSPTGTATTGPDLLKAKEPEASSTAPPAPLVQWSMKALVLSGALGERIRGVLRGKIRAGSEAHRGRAHGPYAGRSTFFIYFRTVSPGRV